MKKVLVAGVTAAVLTLSPVALATASAAPAAPAAASVAVAPAHNSVYPDSVRTRTKVKVAKKQKKRIRKGKRGKIRFNVATVGNAKPAGKVVIVIKGKNKKRGYVKRIRLNYDGGTLKRKLPKLPRGDRYTVRVRFKAPKASVYKNSKDSFKIRVKKRK